MNAIYVDTGAMYRAVALWAQRHGIASSDMQSVEKLAQHAEIEFAGQRILLNGEDVSEEIRRPEIAQAASEVAAIPGVRRAMVALQRDMAEKASLVMEGRDIGTVVFPDAEVKIYLDARPEERAQRRAAELEAKGVAVDLADLTRQIAERDHRDRNRDTSPLIQAPDATFLDSTGLGPEEVEAEILRVIRQRTSN